ncbi:MAG: hypothetical protein NXH88_14085, partial [Hyphomonas sp.]|nr:hypothetical protein [Hyphomonas sp.]
TLEARKGELEVLIADAHEEPVLIHPSMATVYRNRVAQLTEALTDEGRRAEAVDLIRGARGRNCAEPGRDCGQEDAGRRSARPPRRYSKPFLTNKKAAQGERLFRGVYKSGCGGRI